jgi:hypothetical protein
MVGLREAKDCKDRGVAVAKLVREKAVLRATKRSRRQKISSMLYEKALIGKSPAD